MFSDNPKKFIEQKNAQTPTLIVRQKFKKIIINKSMHLYEYF